jgi:Microcystin-dependent protein
MGSLFGSPTSPAIGEDPTSATVRNKLNWLREVLGNLLVNLTDDSAGVTLRDGVAVQPGSLIFNAHTATEPGCLPCDGAAVSRASFPALFAKIGTLWGAGNGSTTFNVPFFNGRTLVCSGTGSGLTPRTVGQNGGFENSLLPLHTHPVNDPGHTHSGSFLQSTGTAIGVTGPGTVTATAMFPAVTGLTIVASGSNPVGGNMMPFAVVRAWIKT